MRIVKAGVLYFALVFGAGFVLGTIRTVWIVPRIGTRMSELMETPIMLVISIVAARWTVLRLAVRALRSVCPPRDGRHRARPHARCGIRVRALASGHLHQRLSRYARPCVGNGLLRDAGCVCHHAASVG